MSVSGAIGRTPGRSARVKKSLKVRYANGSGCAASAMLMRKALRKMRRNVFLIQRVSLRVIA